MCPPTSPSHTRSRRGPALTVDVPSGAVGEHEAEVDVYHAASGVQQNVPVVPVLNLFVRVFVRSSIC